MFALSFQTSSASAQQADCNIAGEAIFNLRSYAPATYTVWDYVYGVSGMERLSDAILLPDGDVIAAGEHFTAEAPDDPKSVIVKISRRERIVWEQRQEKGKSITMTKLLPGDKGAIVTGGILNDKANGVRMRVTFRREDGQMSLEKTFGEKGRDVYLTDIIAAPGGKGYVLSGYAQHRKIAEDVYGLVIRINGKGQEVWRRSYQTGGSNKIFSLAALKDRDGNSFYVAAGEMKGEGGRTAGMALKLGEGGELVWMRQYPRGMESSLRAAGALHGNDFVVLGDVGRIGGEARGGWLMRLDLTAGDIVWQRYFSNDHYSFTASDLHGYPDGRIAVLLRGEVLPEGGEAKKKIELRDYTRLMTVSALGTLMGDEIYTEGIGGLGAHLSLGPQGERVVAGYAKTSYKADDQSDKANYNTDDGWIFIGTPLETYEDPCTTAYR